MGYTHYWRTKKGDLDAATWTLFQDDARRIIVAGRALGIALGGAFGDEPSEPEITDEAVRFNGVGDESHETLALTRHVEETYHPERDPAFDFCKTAYKPYDRVVTAVLLAYKDRFDGTVSLSSDGGPEDWEEGRDLAQSALGREITGLRDEA